MLLPGSVMVFVFILVHLLLQSSLLLADAKYIALVVKDSLLSVSSASTSLIAGALIRSRSEATRPPTAPATPAMNEALLAAAANGSWEAVSTLLRDEAKPSTRDFKLQTPLHLAAANGRSKVTALLLKPLKPKDTGWFADADMTPLHLAARYGDTEIVRQVTSGFKRDWSREKVTDSQAVAKLEKSTAYRSDQQLADFFLRKTFTAVELAAVYGHVDMVLSCSSGTKDGLHQALSIACLMGNVDMVEEILNYNQNLGFFRRYGSLRKAAAWFPAPPLHLAVMARIANPWPCCSSGAGKPKPNRHGLCSKALRRSGPSTARPPIMRRLWAREESW